MPSPATSAAYDLYDRFGFSLPLPDASCTDKLEFCIRFSCDGMEYWDSYNGRNYVAISFRAKDSENKKSAKDAYQLTLDSWTEFASWNHLSLDDTPYWWFKYVCAFTEPEYSSSWVLSQSAFFASRKLWYLWMVLFTAFWGDHHKMMSHCIMSANVTTLEDKCLL